MKRVTVELGGKSPNIVFADADLDKAIPAAAMAVFANSGQICSAGTRLFVQSSIREEFMERLAAFTRTIRVGDPLNPETQIGPVVSAPQMDKILGYIEGPAAKAHRLWWEAPGSPAPAMMMVISSHLPSLPRSRTA